LNIASGEPIASSESPPLGDPPTSNDGEEEMRGRRNQRLTKLTGGSLAATVSIGGEERGPSRFFENLLLNIIFKYEHA
jgi:hypothetical protein